MTYQELFASIQSFMGNNFPEFTLAPSGTDSTTTQINRLITQAEQRIYNEIQFAALRKTTTLTCTTADPYLNAPSDYLSTYALAVVVSGEYQFLLNKDVNFIRSVYPSATDTGVPRYYALFGPALTGITPNDELRFILGPTPDAAYSAELNYYHYPESITVAADGRTWLGDNFDSVLLYGSMVQAAIFMKAEEDLMKLYDAKYKEALVIAKRLGDGLERQDAYRSGQYRQPVT